jgi:hypothetical protein
MYVSYQYLTNNANYGIHGIWHDSCYQLGDTPLVGAGSFKQSCDENLKV